MGGRIQKFNFLSITSFISFPLLKLLVTAGSLCLFFGLASSCKDNSSGDDANSIEEPSEELPDEELVSSDPQNVTGAYLTGKLIPRVGSAPESVGKARILLFGETKGTFFADQNGNIAISGLKPGNHAMIVISQDGKDGIFVPQVKLVEAATTDLGELQLLENGGISGNITSLSEAEQGDFSGTRIYISGSQLETRSDKDGNFILDSVPPGKYSLTIDRIGYEKINMNDLLIESGNTVALEPLVLKISEGPYGTLEIAEKNTITLLGIEYPLVQSPAKLSITSSTNAIKMMVSDNPAFAGAEWIPIAKQSEIAIRRPGLHEVFVKFADANGLESSVLKVPIVIDSSKPKVDSLYINGNLPSTAIKLTQSLSIIDIKAEDQGPSGLSALLLEMTSTNGKETKEIQIENIREQRVLIHLPLDLSEIKTFLKDKAGNLATGPDFRVEKSPVVLPDNHNFEIIDLPEVSQSASAGSHFSAKTSDGKYQLFWLSEDMLGHQSIYHSVGIYSDSDKFQWSKPQVVFSLYSIDIASLRVFSGKNRDIIGIGFIGKKLTGGHAAYATLYDATTNTFSDLKVLSDDQGLIPAINADVHGNDELIFYWGEVDYNSATWRTNNHYKIYNTKSHTWGESKMIPNFSSEEASMTLMLNLANQASTFVQVEFLTPTEGILQSPASSMYWSQLQSGDTWTSKKTIYDGISAYKAEQDHDGFFNHFRGFTTGDSNSWVYWCREQKTFGGGSSKNIAFIKFNANHDPVLGEVVPGVNLDECPVLQNQGFFEGNIGKEESFFITWWDKATNKIRIAGTDVQGDHFSTPQDVFTVDSSKEFWINLAYDKDSQKSIALLGQKAIFEGELVLNYYISFYDETSKKWTSPMLFPRVSLPELQEYTVMSYEKENRFIPAISSDHHFIYFRVYKEDKFHFTSKAIKLRN